MATLTAGHGLLNAARRDRQISLVRMRGSAWLEPPFDGRPWTGVRRTYRSRRPMLAPILLITTTEEDVHAKGRRTLQVPEVLQPYLLALIEGKQPTDPLFSNPEGGRFHRAWPRKWVQRICTEVRVPVVTAHGQRGLHSTLAVEAGVTSRAVADALGHESFATTAQSYANPEAVGRATQARALKVLDGGKGGRSLAAGRP